MASKGHKTFYTTEGSVRGCCGHKHRSIDTAIRCLAADRDGCANQGGYSDRTVVRYDGTPLTDDEQEWIDALADAISFGSFEGGAR